MTPRRIASVALLLFVGGVGAWLLRGQSPLARRAGSDRVRTPEEQIAMLDSSLRALEDGVRDAPRDRWDPAYVVEMVGRNPDSLYRWVQENTAWIPYRGTLRGPVGILMDRQGNSLDRALLLADLLQRAGHTVRLARTVIPSDRAEALLPELAAVRPRMTDLEPVAADLVAISESAERYGLDTSAIVRTLDGYEEATGELLNRVETRVASQTTRLLETVDAIRVSAEWKTRADSALAMLSDHWWVQLETGDSWSDLDVVRRDSAGGVPMPAPLETIAPTQVDASLHHRVTIRVVAERFRDGRLLEEPVLEHTLRPSDAIGQTIILQFWPSAWPALESTMGQNAHSLRQVALEQDGWSVALVIGKDAVAQVTLDASERAVKPAAGIGGLGGAVAGALDPRSDGDDNLLTATSIDFVVDVPGRKQRVVRRSVFDVIGPAARRAGVSTVTLDERQKLHRSLSLMMRTEILPLAAQPNADFVAYRAASNMLANADLLRAVSRPGFGLDARMTDSLLQAAEPGVGPLYALGVLRHTTIGSAVFLDQPTILTRHRYPRVVGDSVGLVDATDIVANEVGVALSESDGFIARLAQGAWDTNLEALLGLAGGPAGNAAAAFERTKDWLTLTRDDKDRLSELELPADALARIGQDLESGYTVVVPQRPVTVDRQEFSAWWRIDPQTGDALGIGDNGWGQGSEYGNLAKNILIVGGRAFVFEYGLCQFIPQMANSLRVIGGEFWRLGIAPSWTRPPEPGKDFEDVAVENNRVCLKQAMLQGFLATAPLLLATARYAAISRVPSLARQQSAYERGWQEAIQRWREASRYCLCIRGQVRGGPIIPRGGGGPGMIDPLGKTEPGIRRTLPGPPPIRTRPGPPPTPKPTAPIRPTDAVEARKQLVQAARSQLADAISAEARAKAAYDQAGTKSYEATRDFVQYRATKQLDPANWSAQRDADLLAKNWSAHAESAARLSELRQAEAARNEAIAAVRRADPFAPVRAPLASSPAPSPPARQIPNCPPNCVGNDNPTGPAGVVQVPASRPSGSLEAGSAGVVNSVTPTVKVNK